MPINKVGSKGIADGSIATADLNDGIVTSAKLQDGSVTNDKLTNTAFTLSGTSVSLGGSATLTNKFVDWQSVITADGSTGTTGVAGRGYFINTTSAAHTFTLPSSATRGDTITIKDYAGTFASNNLTINRNGHNIQGVANNSLINTNRASLVLVYVDSTKGWLYAEEHNVASLGQALFTSATGGTIVTDGDFKVHSFTGDGCFVVSQVGNSPVAPTGGPSNIDLLVVAGGGGGQLGFNCKATGGGGGAGGLILTSTFPISSTTYPISIGGGGTGGPGATPGTNSTGLGLTAVGGGKGGTLGAGPCNNSGGSGGGAGQLCFSPTNPGATKSGGSGNQICQPGISGSSGFGNPGGGGKTLTAPFNNPQASGSGGGGGAGTAGSVGTYAGAAGNGGNGKDVTPVFGASPKSFYIANGPNAGASAPGVFAGGGGGGGPTGGTGGTGGGGDGGSNPGPSPTSLGKAGIANTGGGGGGGQNNGGYSGGSCGAAGGKGIVIIRYKFQ